MAGDEHGRTLVGQAAQQDPHLTGSLRVQAVRRLVEEQQAGVPEQRRGDPEALPHPLAVRLDPLVRGRLEARDPKDVVDPAQPGVAVAGGPRRTGQALEVLAAGQVLPERGLLHHGPHTAQCSDGVGIDPAVAEHRASQHLDLARRREYERERHPKRGGLPCSVRPQESVQRAFLDGEVQSVDGGHVPVALGQSPRGQGDHGRPLMSGLAPRRQDVSPERRLPPPTSGSRGPRRRPRPGIRRTGGTRRPGRRCPNV